MFLPTKWEMKRVLGIFLYLQGLNFLIACCIICPGSYLENKKEHFSNKKGPFSLLSVFLNKKTVFSLHFKMGTSKSKLDAYFV